MKCWEDLAILCFPTNKRNYARYGTYYIEQMKDLPTTHPGAVEELLEKGISVRRNNIGIGQSIDGAGEQTFMRSAKTRGGIKSFTSNDATYSKWVLSRPFQAKFVEALLDMIDKGDQGSHSKCLRKSEITRSEQRIVQMNDILTNTFINPFTTELDDEKLFNIASGCPIPDEAADCLLSIHERGKSLHANFRTRLSGESELNFWDPVKNQEWKDFTISNRICKVDTSKGKTIAVKVQRDVLGFLLAKSQELETTVDLEEALKYPLSPIPLAIAHGDGQRRKTNKSVLLNYILTHQEASTSIPPNIQGEKVYILDLAAVIRSTVKVPDTFEQLALKLLQGIPEQYRYVYIACDTYRDVSIKALERKLRGESSKILIRSGKVKIPPQFQKFLCNGENKERLFELIESTWIQHKDKVGIRDIYFARGNSCVKITQEGSVSIPQLETNHEEADSKIAYLIQHAIIAYPNIMEILVRSCSGDVDIPVILIGLFGSSSKNVILDNGTGKHRKKIRMDGSIWSELQCNALVGYHAFSGNDYVSSFLRKTKKVWEKVKDDEESLDFFNKLGDDVLDDDIFMAAETFVCKLYGDKNCHSVNSLRHFFHRVHQHCGSTLPGHIT